YCTAHKSIPYKLVFGQLPHCDTNLADILENEESLNNHALVSEDSQSTIVSEINNKTAESELDEIYFEELQEYNNDDDDKQEFNNKSLYNFEIREFDNESLYNSEIEECSKHTLTPEIIEIVNSDMIQVKINVILGKKKRSGSLK
ncbi:10572_t:CDS:2, partial [Racocetra fulgida]